MGVFSKIHRFHEAGEDANVNNVENFGVPAYSLFTPTKILSLHHQQGGKPGHRGGGAGQLPHLLQNPAVSLWQPPAHGHTRRPGG